MSASSPFQTNLNLFNTLPAELIDMILSLLDTSALFRLCHVSQLLRSLVQPRLFTHASQVTMRLWVCQPGLLAHKPIDFGWSHCDHAAHQMVFSPTDPASAALALQTALPPPRIDGCTVLIKVGNAKRIYSISYKDCVVPVPIDATFATYSKSAMNEQQQCKAKEELEEAYYGCAWQFAYTIHDVSPTARQLVPNTFTCDMDLLDPKVLTSSASRDMVVDVTRPEHPMPTKNTNTSTATSATKKDTLPPFLASRIWADSKNVSALVEHL